MRWRWPNTSTIIVLFSGDGDFRSLVEAVQRKGVRVSVVSTNSTQPAMIADELRRQADEFIDLMHLVIEDRPRPQRTDAPLSGPAPRGPWFGRRTYRRTRTPTTRRADQGAPPCGPLGLERADTGRRLSALPAAGRLPRGRPGTRAILVQCAGPDLRRSRRAASRRRLGARIARRQSDGASVHRRLRRRPFVRHPARSRLGRRALATSDVPTTAWRCTAAPSPTRFGACRRRTNLSRRRSRPAAGSSPRRSTR